VSAISVREIALLGAALGQIAVRGELWASRRELTRPVRGTS